MTKLFTKKATAILLSLLFVFSALTIIPPLTANASPNEIIVEMIDYPRGAVNPAWVRPALNFNNGWSVTEGLRFSVKGVANQNMAIAYCVQVGVPINTGDRNPIITSQDFLHGYDNSVLDALQIQEQLGRIFQYGYTGIATYSLSDEVLSEIIATQLLVWEVIVGERNPDFTHRTQSSQFDRITDMITDIHPLRSQIFAHYDRIVTAVQNHSRIPSFMARSAFLAPTHDMAWDGTQFPVTLTDTNGVLAGFNFTSPTAGVRFTQNGNYLTINMDTAPTSAIEIHASRSDTRRSAIVFWAAYPIHEKNQPQALITVGKEITDSIPAFAQLGVSTGSLRITKTVEYWHTLAGFQFEVRRAADNHLIGTFTSPASGEIYIPNLIAGDYIVREIVPNGFVAPTPNPRTVGQTATLAPNTTFNNIRQHGTITVTKLDRNTNTRAQGDATLNGAIFDIYDANGQRVDTINTGNSNQGTSRPLPIPNVYFVVERTPPNGYTNDGGIRHRIELTYFAPHVAIGNENVTIYNCVIRGRISLIKFTDANPETPQIMNPLEGAIFEIFLRSAGSFDNALSTERARIITDANGFAETPLLPFGWYTVVEVYGGGADVRLVEPFDVFIDRDGYVHRFILDNPVFTSRVRVNKVDSTTGLRIPAAGVEFRIRDLSTGGWVTQTFYYPTPTAVSVFRTNEQGWLVTPQPLGSGNFELWEISAPYGFILSSVPMPFTIHSSVAGEENIIDVVMENDPAMGTISIEKRGNMLVGVQVVETEFGYKHIPVFAERGLYGAIFNVVAAEDIIVGGTLRYSAGQVVDIIVTCPAGRAESRPLFLGHYHLIEQYSPAGFVLDDTPISVVLSYADQYTPIVREFIGIQNIRQQVSIELQKWMETLNGQTAPFQDVIFGLFADEDIFCVDGELIIGVGSLVSFITLSNTGHSDFVAELPWMQFSIRELATAEGYRITDEIFVVNVESAEQSVSIITITVNNGEPIRNYLMRGDLRVIKTFEGRDIPVAGVPFSFVGYTVVGIRVQFYAATDINGEIVLEGLPIGEWTAIELSGDANIGFVLSESRTVAVTIDELAEMAIHNYRIRGDIRVLKVCAITGNRLPGAVFGLYLDGNRIAEAISDRYGIAKFIGVEFNEYIIKELASPNGFHVTDEVFAVSITENGETIEITVYNEPVPPELVPEIPEVPKTGDDEMPWVILIISALGFLASGSVLVVKNAKKKTN